MKEVKCFWCNEKSPKDEMNVEEKGTGKFNKNGTEKMQRKYFHKNCHINYLDDKKFKENEALELDNLYKFLLKIYDLDALDPRMMERIQDLRNGTIKVNNKKIKKYKEGVTYQLMLDTYQMIESRIRDVLRTNTSLETSWNKFAYTFGMVIRNVNDVKNYLKQKTKQEYIHSQKQINQETEEIKVNKKVIKKDELDISDFL